MLLDRIKTNTCVCEMVFRGGKIQKKCSEKNNNGLLEEEKYEIWATIKGDTMKNPQASVDS